MSLLTLEYPATILPGLPAQDGQHFEGYVRGGKLHVSVHDFIAQAADIDSSDSNHESAVAQFVKRWHGQGKLLPPDETDQDPRLASLTAKHIH